MLIYNKLRHIILIITVVLFVFPQLHGQNRDYYQNFIEFNNQFISGEFVKAEKLMTEIISNSTGIPPYYLMAALNNLGLVYKEYDQFDKALETYEAAESIAYNSNDYDAELSSIYNNKGRIFIFYRLFDKAIEHFEKGARILNDLKDKSQANLFTLSQIYLNLGIAHFESKYYSLSEKFLRLSLDLKQRNNLDEIELVYLNLGKTNAMMGLTEKADSCYKTSIDIQKRKFGNTHDRLIDTYFSYGTFLMETGRAEEGTSIHKEAVDICLRKYGKKHSLTSKGQELTGDDFMARGRVEDALSYYQNALISIVPSFNNAEFYSNPSIDSSFFDIRLLDILKKKSRALVAWCEQYSSPGEKESICNIAVSTIELALNLIDKIRSDYPSEESRLYLAANENDTYDFAIRSATLLYNLAGESEPAKERIYDIAKRAKSSILLADITGNNLMYSSGIPDSILSKRDSLNGLIAAYNRLLIDEIQYPEPDSSRMLRFKDAIFSLNNEKDKLTNLINSEFPAISKLISATRPSELKEIMRSLKRNEAIVDYYLGSENKESGRLLYIFLITRSDLELREMNIDSSLNSAINSVVKLSSKAGFTGQDIYKEHTQALHQLFLTLIKPVEQYLKGKSIIIIPDEEISVIPFETLLKSLPDSGKYDYENLDYLISEYPVSYAYSSSLVRPGGRRMLPFARPLIASFTPEYEADNNQNPGIRQLNGAIAETEALQKLFRGNRFIGSEASETNFKKSYKGSAILHLAMHSISDTTNPQYSYLLFSAGNDTLNDGRLHTYEVDLMRSGSRMVVLSSCNSGSGRLFHGEGLKSLARSFILSGASSVIRTGWEVNDEVSADIIIRYYKNLKRGMAKDEALRRAKLQFIKESSPSLHNPGYWASYQLAGDNSPVVLSPAYKLLIIISAIVILVLVYYFRRRRIF